MKTRTFNLLVTLFISAIILSCAKEKVDPEDEEKDTDKVVKDEEKPVINFNEEINSLYSIGATVDIDFTTTDNDTLKMVELKVTNTTIDSVYLHEINNPDQPDLTMQEQVVTDITTQMADFEITVNAEDNSGNKTSTSKSFHVMN